jgi:hypothetical protein
MDMWVVGMNLEHDLGYVGCSHKHGYVVYFHILC